MARALVVDLDRCSGCEACVVSCKFQNNLDLGNYFSHVVEVGPTGEFPDIERYWLPIQCQQCSNAPCVEICPTGASYRDSDNGAVLIDADTCIGCKTCLSACPYSDPTGAVKPSVRWFNEAEQIVQKCTLCNDLTATSDGVENDDDPFDSSHAVPPCVHNCTCGARYFGDLDDPNSAASQALAKAENEGRAIHSIEAEGAQPVAKYILSADIATWQGLGER